MVTFPLLSIFILLVTLTRTAVNLKAKYYHWIPKNI